MLAVSLPIIFAQVPAFASSLEEPVIQERVLKQAQALIEKDEEDRGAMREAINLLDKYEAQFPQEPRFPLYLAEAYYRMANPEANIDKEFPIYEKVETYAGKVLKLDPSRPEGHYWFGLFLLKKAQKTGGIRAYSLTRNGIRELESVRATLPGYDHAGASRVLAQLYCVAPGWTPFGDIDKSILLGQEAVRIDPVFPLNHLYLADAYNKRGDSESAINEYRKVLSLPSLSKCDREKAGKMLRKLGAAVSD